MMNGLAWTVLALGAVLSWLLVGAALRVARGANMLDLPGERQSHTEPTPTGGGAGIVVATILISAWLGWQWGNTIAGGWLQLVLPGMTILGIVGWLDDRRHVSTLLRLFVQLAVSFGLLASLGIAGKEGGWWLFAAAGLFITWVMNFFNFMDGSHGMAGFQTVFCSLAMVAIFLCADRAELAFPALVLAGSCLGFLPWNFPAPKVFMGDAGSVPLGFAVAGLMTLGWHEGALQPAVAVLLLSVFLVDSSLTLLKRVIRGERWYTAHKQHVYQRLIGHGWSHSRVLLLYQAINLLLVAPSAALALMYPEYAWPVTGAVALLLVAGWQTASLRTGVRDER